MINKEKADSNQLSFIALNIGEIYKDGIPVKQAVALVRETILNKTYKKSLEKVSKALTSGKSLSESFKTCPELYPEFFTGLIYIGENTGELQNILFNLGEYYKKISEIKKQIKSMLFYPVLLFLGMAVLGVIFIKTINPSFMDIYKSMSSDPPQASVLMNDIKNYCENNIMSVIIAAVCWISALIILVKNFAVKKQINIFTKLKIVQKLMEYILTLVFSIITGSGISIITGINYCIGSISPEFLNNKLIEIKQSILSGKNLTESMEKSEVFSNYSLSIMKVHEETGEIKKGFGIIKTRTEKDVTESVQKIVQFIPTAMIMVFGAALAAVLMIFVIPMFDKMQLNPA